MTKSDLFLFLPFASVEIVPFGKPYKFDPKTGRFDPSAHHYLLNIVRSFVNDFSVGDFVSEWHTEWSVKIQRNLLVWDNVFIIRFLVV